MLLKVCINILNNLNDQMRKLVYLIGGLQFRYKKSVSSSLYELTTFVFLHAEPILGSIPLCIRLVIADNSVLL